VPRKGLNYETDPPDSRGMYLVVVAMYVYVCACVRAIRMYQVA